MIASELEESIERIVKAKNRRQQGILLSGIKENDDDLVKGIKDACPWLQAIVAGGDKLQIVL